jgi:hypothetical protein
MNHGAVILLTEAQKTTAPPIYGPNALMRTPKNRLARQCDGGTGLIPVGPPNFHYRQNSDTSAVRILGVPIPMVDTKPRSSGIWPRRIEFTGYPLHAQGKIKESMTGIDRRQAVQWW